MRKALDIFFGCFWIFASVLAFSGVLTPFTAGCACLLAALYNFENIFE